MFIRSRRNLEFEPKRNSRPVRKYGAVSYPDLTISAGELHGCYSDSDSDTDADTDSDTDRNRNSNSESDTNFVSDS
jgi:hypothetical protein